MPTATETYELRKNHVLSEQIFAHLKPGAQQNWLVYAPHTSRTALVFHKVRLIPLCTWLNKRNNSFSAADTKNVIED